MFSQRTVHMPSDRTWTSPSQPALTVASRSVVPCLRRAARCLGQRFDHPTPGYPLMLGKWRTGGRSPARNHPGRESCSGASNRQAATQMGTRRPRARPPIDRATSRTDRTRRRRQPCVRGETCVRWRVAVPRSLGARGGRRPTFGEFTYYLLTFNRIQITGYRVRPPPRAPPRGGWSSRSPRARPRRAGSRGSAGSTRRRAAGRPR